MPRPDVHPTCAAACALFSLKKEGEEDKDEEEEEDSDERGDENEDGLQQQMGPPPFNTASESRETLAAAEHVAQRIHAYSVRRRDHHPEPSEVTPMISYRPSVDDPGLWTLQHEREVVSQILWRCLALGDRAPQVTSAFNREAIPGYVFIEAFTVQDVDTPSLGLSVPEQGPSVPQWAEVPERFGRVGGREPERNECESSGARVNEVGRGSAP
ncbi:hypothetical protein BC834DRAFT_847973 [Gloeopeniophorella convolvens]|nr:hypothetical protein BC834DRAFT_847973 [Gloeopeniophorella convolvens]